MFNRTRATAAILLAAGVAMNAQAATPPSSTPKASTPQAPTSMATSRLAVKAGLFAATVDIAAGHLGGWPQAASLPTVANGTAAAGVAAAQASPQVAAAEHDPEKVAIGAEIFDNLKLIDIAVVGVRTSFNQDPNFQALPVADRLRLEKLLEEEVRARRDIIEQEMAEANVDRFTLDQLHIILRLSQTTFLQAVVLHTAGLGPEPDVNSMTPAEKTLIAAYGGSAFLSDFLEHTDFTPLRAEVGIAVQNAFARFQAGQTG